MINLTDETVLSLTGATQYLPRRRVGKRPHVATLYRWAQSGCRGVKLETLQVGGTMCTSLEALQRFCERLSGNEPGVPSKTSKQRVSEIAKAEAELSAAGI